MKNRELALRRIQTVEGRLKQLQQSINFGNKDDISFLMRELTELIEDVKSIIEREN
jgi:uncharacterized membrane-anchored protein